VIDYSRAIDPIPQINWLPFINDKPSFACNLAFVSPCCCKTCSAASYWCVVGFHSSPSPIKFNPIWLSGTRSPEAPTVPHWGIWGTHPLLKSYTRQFMVSGDIPLYPLAKLLILNACILREASSGSTSPMPVAWERMRFSWYSSMSSSLILTFEKIPTPVLIPK
jgi:hypothetical protein